MIIPYYPIINQSFLTIISGIFKARGAVAYLPLSLSMGKVSLKGEA